VQVKKTSSGDRRDGERVARGDEPRRTRRGRLDRLRCRGRVISSSGATGSGQAVGRALAGSRRRSNSAVRAVPGKYEADRSAKEDITDGMRSNRYKPAGLLLRTMGTVLMGVSFDHQ